MEKKLIALLCFSFSFYDIRIVLINQLKKHELLCFMLAEWKKTDSNTCNKGKKV